MLKAALIFVLQFGFSTIVYANENLTRLVLEQFQVGEVSDTRAASQSSPIRQARLNVKIQKATLFRRPDGSVTFRLNDVCSGSAFFNVYDARLGGSPVSPEDLERFTCRSDFDGQPIEMVLGGSVGIFSNPLLGKRPIDYKMMVPILWSKNSGRGLTQPLIVSQNSGSTDVNTHSLLVILKPTQIFNCPSVGRGPCTPAVNEFFAANVEVVD